MAQKALIVWGGWDGHEPQPVGESSGRGALRAKGFETEISDTLNSFLDADKLKSLNLDCADMDNGQNLRRAIKRRHGSGQERSRESAVCTAECATRSAKRPNGSL